MTIAVIDPFTGLSGDMLLGALLDAGAPLDTVRDAIQSIGLPDASLAASQDVDHGLAGTRARVTVADGSGERRAGELIEIAGRCGQPVVAALAVEALTLLAEVEGALHGVPAENVHLHELGGHDTIVDIVGVCAAVVALEVDEVYCGRLPLGRGSVHTAHGVLPLPAPATARLLAGASVEICDLTTETVTPTAAVLLRVLRARYDRPPAFELATTGYGLGTRSLADRPNVAAVHLGQALGRADLLYVLQTNLDDVTGELLGHAIQRVLDEAALDVWVTPATMKKGRPGHVLHVLADQANLPRLTEVVLRETGTLGVRWHPVERTALARDVVTVTVGGQRIRVKRGPFGEKPEFEDVVTAAAQLDRPWRDVAEDARRLVARGVQ
jgi:uncharacterized protein (TIGR00299 family) protein